MKKNALNFANLYFGFRFFSSNCHFLARSKCGQGTGGDV